jgi:hypothetical protein
LTEAGETFVLHTQPKIEKPERAAHPTLPNAGWCCGVSVYLGFSGGGFDEVRVLDQLQYSTYLTFNPDAPNLIAIDNIAAVGATPLPGALPLFATGLGALGLLDWRRKRKGGSTT